MYKREDFQTISTVIYSFYAKAVETSEIFKKFPGGRLRWSFW